MASGSLPSGSGGRSVRRARARPGATTVVGRCFAPARPPRRLSAVAAVAPSQICGQGTSGRACRVVSLRHFRVARARARCRRAAARRQQPAPHALDVDALPRVSNFFAQLLASRRASRGPWEARRGLDRWRQRAGGAESVLCKSCTSERGSRATTRGGPPARRCASSSSRRRSLSPARQRQRMTCSRHRLHALRPSAQGRAPLLLGLLVPLRLAGGGLHSALGRRARTARCTHARLSVTECAEEQACSLARLGEGVGRRARLWPACAWRARCARRSCRPCAPACEEASARRPAAREQGRRGRAQPTHLVVLPVCAGACHDEAVQVSPVLTVSQAPSPGERLRDKAHQPLCKPHSALELPRCTNGHTVSPNCALFTAQPELMAAPRAPDFSKSARGNTELPLQS